MTTILGHNQYMAYKEHTLNDNVSVQMHIGRRNYANSRIKSILSKSTTMKEQWTSNKSINTNIADLLTCITNICFDVIMRSFTLQPDARWKLCKTSLYINPDWGHKIPVVCVRH